MTTLRHAILSRGVRLAGGRPEIVLPLTRALEKSATGQTEMLRQQKSHKTIISTETLRLIVMTGVAVVSVFLAVLVVVNPGNLRPPLAIIALVTVHYLMVANMVVSSSAPGLLMEDDSETIGWWPVTRREVMLARLGMILKPAMEITGVLLPVPLIAVAIKMTPPVATALLLGIGLLIQTIAVTFGVVVLLLMLLRWLGRRRAQRMAGLVSDGNIMFLALPAFVFGEQIVQGISTHSWVLNLLPPTWFAAWGDPMAGAMSLMRASFGLVSSVVLVALGLRIAVSSPTSAMPEPVEKPPSRWHMSRLVCLLISPWFRGVEGRVVRLLLEAHLREDWRFMGSVVGMSAVMGFMFFGMGHRTFDVDAEVLRITALTAVRYSHFPIIMGGSIMFLATYSNMARAMWVVALGDLNAFRLLTAQRGIIHGLITTPVLVLYGIRGWMLGASLTAIVMDGVLLAMELELVLLTLQPLVLTMPFSRAYAKDQSGRRVLQMVISIGVAVVCVLSNHLYTKWFIARVVLWTVLPLALIFMWLLVRRLTRGKRLHMDVVVS